MGKAKDLNEMSVAELSATHRTKRGQIKQLQAELVEVGAEHTKRTAEEAVAQKIKHFSPAELEALKRLPPGKAKE